MVIRPFAHWPAWGVLVLAVALAASCSRSTQPTRTYAINGRVQLRATLVGADSKLLGTRTIDDADGVPVWLTHGSATVASTSTAAGAFHFGGLEPGSYIVRTGAYAPLSTPSPYLILTSADVNLSAPLVLATVGDLLPAPNPVGGGSTVWFDVTMPYRGVDSTHVLVQVRGASGNPVGTLTNGFFKAGLHSVWWNCRDTTNQMVPGRFMWLTYEADGGDDRQLLLLP